MNTYRVTCSAHNGMKFVYVVRAQGPFEACRMATESFATVVSAGLTTSWGEVTGNRL